MSVGMKALCPDLTQAMWFPRGVVIGCTTNASGLAPEQTRPQSYPRMLRVLSTPQRAQEL